MKKKKGALFLYAVVGCIVFLSLLLSDATPDLLGGFFLAAISLLFWPFMLFNVAMMDAYSFAISAVILLLDLTLLSTIFWLWLSAPRLPQKRKEARKSTR